MGAIATPTRVTFVALVGATFTVTAAVPPRHPCSRLSECRIFVAPLNVATETRYTSPLANPPPQNRHENPKGS